MIKKPIIGISLDSEAAGGYSKMPWYALRQNYVESVARAGGLPLLLPHEPDLAHHYLSLIDGLLITGGAFDVDPSLWGAEETHETVKTKPRRTLFELAMVRGALEDDMPILGICGGQQLLAVVLGGTLIQHIPDEIENCLAHEQPNPRTEAGHEVLIAEDTLLRRITGDGLIAVNSAHHQAVDRLPEGVIINAIAKDGVIEGIECPDKRFCLGVQWHPEYDISDADFKIFQAFIEACH